MSLGSNPIIRILAIFLMLSGCALTPQHLTEQSQNAIKNIAIVSLVPESVNFDKIEIISSGNKYTEFAMGSKITDSILAISQGRIAEPHPDWTVKNVSYDRAALLAKVKLGFGFAATQARQAFADMARSNDLDAIFVVRAAEDTEDNMQQRFEPSLREGLNVQLKNNDLGGDSRLVIRANLIVTIVGKNGEAMAVGTVPARLDTAKALEPDNYDVTDNMVHNHRPEVLEMVGQEVIVDLTRRLNLCFDSLGFAGQPFIPEAKRSNVVPQVDGVTEPAAQASPAANSFDQCFSRCRQYTDRTKEQCFDACNK